MLIHIKFSEISKTTSNYFSYHTKLIFSLFQSIQKNNNKFSTTKMVFNKL